MVLKDTVDMMCSDDYKERFKAEYCQLKIRLAALDRMLVKLQAGTLNFKPACSTVVLMNQKRQMQEYLTTLEVRAEVEGIVLEGC